MTGESMPPYSLNPDGDLPPGASCTVTVIGASVTDTDTRDGADGDANSMTADHVFSYTVSN